MEKLEAEGNFNFSYNSELINERKLVSIQIENGPVRDALYLLLGDDFTYKQRGEHLILKKTKKNFASPQPKKQVCYQRLRPGCTHRKSYSQCQRI